MVLPAPAPPGPRAVATPPSEAASSSSPRGSTGRSLCGRARPEGEKPPPGSAGDAQLSPWSTQNTAPWQAHGEFRRQAPWTSCSNVGRTQPHRTLAEGTRRKLAQTNEGCFWGPRSEVLDRGLAPSGWHAAHAVEGLFEHPPAEAKRFVWENDDGYWVNGTLADTYLRKLMEAGEPQSLAQRIGQPLSEGELQRALPRRGACQESFCSAFDPVLNVPLNLVDQLELNNDVRPTAKMLLAEANIGACLRRACLKREDLVLDAFFKARKPALNRLRFAVRADKRAALVESGGDSLSTNVEQRIERTEYEINMTMLPHLKDWCERYRNVKMQRNSEKARQSALEQLHDAATEVPGGLCDDGASQAEHEAVLEKSKHAVHMLQPDRPLLLCRCGHAEVWHCKPAGDSPPCATPQEAATGLTSSLPLLPPGPTSLMRELPPQGRDVFPMIGTAPQRRAPLRVASEPSISGGRLLLKQAGVSTLQRKPKEEPEAALPEPVKAKSGKKKGKKGAVSPSSALSQASPTSAAASS